MWLDILVVGLLVLSVFYGFKKGVIFMIFLAAGISVGIFASLHLSYITATYIQTYIPGLHEWLPGSSFVITFLLVLFLARTIARIVEGILKVSFLNLFNKLIGAAISLLVAFLSIVIGIWYLGNLTILSPELSVHSISYSISMAFAPAFLEKIAVVLPFFNSLLDSLNQLFEQFAVNKLQMNQ